MPICVKSLISALKNKEQNLSRYPSEYVWDRKSALSFFSRPLKRDFTAGDKVIINQNILTENPSVHASVSKKRNTAFGRMRPRRLKVYCKECTALPPLNLQDKTPENRQEKCFSPVLTKSVISKLPLWECKIGSSKMQNGKVSQFIIIRTAGGSPSRQHKKKAVKTQQNG